MKTSVAVIVSTYNWPEALTLCVRSLFRQTLLPDEIIIADDGSGESTKRAVVALTEAAPCPVKHVWHEDNGFRLSEIRNKAIAAAESEYIIQVDGDCILERHFVEDHMSLARNGYFVCGSRVKLPADESASLLARYETAEAGDIRVKPSSPFFTNSLRIAPLRMAMARLYGRRLGHMRGCNMAFWRSDLILVNGYNEGLSGWGHEDQELAWRLKFAGIKKKCLKFGGVCYHLHHKEASKGEEWKHNDLIKSIIETKSTRCEKGIDRHTKEQ